MEPDASPQPEIGVVQAVDAALGFVAGQRWVSRRLAVALLKGVRDAAGRERRDPLDPAIEVALGVCDEDPMRGSRLTDLLLDLRNVAADYVPQRATRA